jgi:hypothetical protein
MSKLISKIRNRDKVAKISKNFNKKYYSNLSHEILESVSTKYQTEMERGQTYRYITTFTASNTNLKYRNLLL